MTRRLFLPVLPFLEPASQEGAPTVESMRRALGGRVPAKAGAVGSVGSLVAMGEAGEQLGVVLCVEGERVDVWLGDGLVKKTSHANVQPARQPAPSALAEMARDARRFDCLREGDRVGIDAAEGFVEGELLEKCRFGALVRRADGRVVAAGFRRLWPLTPRGDAPN